MSILEKAFELSVVISAVDKFTNPMKKAQQSMTQTQKNIDTVTKAMKVMGKSSDDINKVTSSIEKLDRDRKFQTLAKDLKAAGMSSKEIDNLRQGFDKLEESSKRVDSLTQSFDKFKKTAIVGGAITAFGFKMAEGLAKATEEAGHLLTTLTTIQSATGASNNQMDSIYGTIKSTSAETKYGIPQTAKLGALLSTSGYNAKETQQLLPVFTKLAEVQEFGKGANPEETVKKAMELAHGFGKYSPDELNTFLNDYNKATFLQPEDSAKFGETLKYTMTQGKTLGLSDKDILYSAALSNRMGLAGSMGGTNAADMLLRAIPGISGGLTPKVKYEGSGKNKHVASITYPKQLQAMMEVGLADSEGNSPFFDKGGKLTDMSGFIDTLFTHTSNLDPKKKALVYHDIFGQQGMRAALLFGSEKGQEQLSALHEGMNRIHSIDQMQHDYNQTPEGQIAQLKSNLENLKFNVFLEMAKSLNPLLKNLNQLVEKMIKFSDQHPKIAQMAASFAVLGTTTLILAGSLTSLISVLGMAKTGFERLGISKGIEKGTNSSPGFLGKMFGSGDKTPVANKLGKGLKLGGALSIISAGYDIYQASKESGGLRKGLSEHGGSIVGSAVGGTAGAALGSLAGPVGTVAGGMVGSWLGGKLGGLLDTKGITKKVVDGFVSAWEKLKSLTTSTFNTVSTKIKGFIDNTKKWFADFPQHIGYAVGYAVGWIKQLPDRASKYFSDLYQSASKWTSQTIKDIEKWWSELPGKTDKFWNDTWTAVEKWASDTYKSAVDWAKKTYDDVVKWFESIPDKITGFFKGAGDWIDNVVEKAKNFKDQFVKGYESGKTDSGLPKKAWGGFVSSPVIAGEDGPEAIIPLSKRSRGIDLWQQAGEALGVGGSGGGIYIAPGAIVINAQSNHDEQEIARRVIKAIGKEKRRAALNSGMSLNLGSV
jgi:hypothetical protein